MKSRFVYLALCPLDAGQFFTIVIVGGAFIQSLANPFVAAHILLLFSALFFPIVTVKEVNLHWALAAIVALIIPISFPLGVYLFFKKIRTPKAFFCHLWKFYILLYKSEQLFIKERKAQKLESAQQKQTVQASAQQNKIPISLKFSTSIESRKYVD